MSDLRHGAIGVDGGRRGGVQLDGARCGTLGFAFTVQLRLHSLEAGEDAEPRVPLGVLFDTVPHHPHDPSVTLAPEDRGQAMTFGQVLGEARRLLSSSRWRLLAVNCFAVEPDSKAPRDCDEPKDARQEADLARPPAALDATVAPCQALLEDGIDAVRIRLQGLLLVAMTLGAPASQDSRVGVRGQGRHLLTSTAHGGLRA
mmetsp:Transcript_97252/g.208648  ORF Transcript_97252/g.208648 Transcript_97252/m.208648 type:complete len:201 (+) Transcript_97252:1767-2369(+)